MQSFPCAYIIHDAQAPETCKGNPAVSYDYYAAPRPKETTEYRWRSPGLTSESGYAPLIGGVLYEIVRPNEPNRHGDGV